MNAARMNRALLVLIVGLALGGVLLSTRNGIGTSPDSAVYLGAAANVQQGKGLSVPFGTGLDGPLTRFPPLYPLVLAGVGALRIPSGHAGRVVSALALAGLILVVAATSPRVAAAGAVGALLLAVSPPITMIYQMAWSEGLFLLLGFSGLLFLGWAIERRDRRWYWASAAAVALACLTRYAGIAFLVGGAAGVVLWDGEAATTRLRRAVIYFAVGLVPLMLWMTAVASAGGGIGGRQAGLHLPGRVHLQQTLGTLAGWLMVPVEASGWMKLGILCVFGVLVAGVALSAGGQGERPRASPIPIGLRLLAVTLLSYACFLILVLTLVDANMPLDDRILSPLLVAAIVLMAFIFGRALGSGRSQRWLAFLILGALVVLLGTRSLAMVREGSTHGIGFARSEWRDSETIARVRDLPQGIPVFSDSPEAIYLLTGRAASRWPREFILTSQSVNDRFGAELAEVDQVLGRSGGAVIDFDRIDAEMEIARLTAVPLQVTEASDGQIYEFGAGG